MSEKDIDAWMLCFSLAGVWIVEEYSRQVGGICRGRNKGSLGFIYYYYYYCYYFFVTSLDRV